MFLSDPQICIRAKFLDRGEDFSFAKKEAVIVDTMNPAQPLSAKVPYLPRFKAPCVTNDV